MQWLNSEYLQDEFYKINNEEHSDKVDVQLNSCFENSLSDFRLCEACKLGELFPEVKHVMNVVKSENKGNDAKSRMHFQMFGSKQTTPEFNQR